MLGKKNAEVQITTLLGRNSEINGDFTVEGSARVDGKINGNVTVTGTLIEGVTGVINGNVTAESVMIGGEVLGDITVNVKTELMETARVIGDITTNLIVIDEKAIFQGGCNMNKDVPDKRARAKAARTNKKTAKEAIEEALKEVEEQARKEEQNGGGSIDFQGISQSQE